MQTRKSMIERIWDWGDSRYDLTTLMDALLHVEIPRSARTYYLGGITLFLFMVQVITGILLTIYYQPTPETAYNSVMHIMNEVRFGWLIRSIHAWSANLMVLFCVLHLLRVFFQGAYKKPREMTWVVGILLLGITMGFGFSGYLLPWDQRAFWATTVGTEIAGAIPIIGQPMLTFLRGGEQVTAQTLTRFYGGHVLVMPAALGALLIVHLTMIHQQGLADPKQPGELLKSDGKTIAESKKKDLLPFFPNYMVDEFVAWYVMLAAFVVLASIFPAGLEEPANPLHTPEHTKPEWYFLFLYELLKHIPRILGVTLPLIGGGLLLLLPFLDRNPEVEARKRPVAIAIGIITIIFVIVFTIWGWLS